MGTTSSVKDLLFGDTQAYSQLLEPVATQLVHAYPSDDLKPVFESLPHRSITVGPMSMCARALQDLHQTANDTVLQGVGTICLHISTHDDLIDEPADRREQAARLYAGNISFIEGNKLLLNVLKSEQISFIWRQVSRNHLLQWQRVDRLWENAPHNFAEYAHGVEDDGALVGIGVCAALTAAGQEQLWPQLEAVCAGYGTALQLLDDIAEVDEDRASGYHSFPLFEGPPYRQSFMHIRSQLDAASLGIPEEWTHFKELFALTRHLADGLEAKSARQP